MTTRANEFAKYCCELLSTVGPCEAKRMFGGYGISTDGLTIAILADLGKGDRLWLKASAETSALFESAGCERFTYLAKGQTKSMGYYCAPDEAMESTHEMTPWARLALDAALAARQPQRKRAKSDVKS
jgi:DNA transformation protein